MSVTMTKGEGLAVFTMTSNPKSAWPPLCQIFGALCYSPLCCSVSQGLRRLLGSFSALATTQIMVGLLTIGLGAIRLSAGSSWIMRWYLPTYWLGGLFIAFGIMCILAEKFPNPCLVGINVLMSLVGVALAITAIVLYAIQLGNIQNDLWWLCRKDEYYWKRRNYDVTAATPSSKETSMQESYMAKCREGKELLSMVLGGLDVVLLILAVLQLCVTISVAVLGIKALKRSRKEWIQSVEDPESFQPLVQEVNANTTA